MNNFINYKFADSEEFINTFDEVPLWSTRFGFLLLDQIEVKKNMKVLDVGSGTGFPLLPLAERLGESSMLYGIDPWVNANNIARRKIASYGLKNVEIFDQSAESIPLESDYIDLVTINIGINNFKDRDAIFKECYRVLKPGGKLAITTNIFGHWKEYYDVFESTLIELDKTVYLDKIKEEQEYRANLSEVSGMFIRNGFLISKYMQDSFTMNFIDGTAFLNHHFIKCGWIESWFSMFPEDDRIAIFTQIEQRLNEIAEKEGSLNLSVPMVFIEGQKPSHSTMIDPSSMIMNENNT